MVNTFAITDYDVYQDEAFDNYRRRPRRAHRKRFSKRKFRNSRVTRYPKLGRPPRNIRYATIKRRPKVVVRKPRIIRGRPLKLPPVKVRPAYQIKPAVLPRTIVKQKPAIIKKKVKPVVKKKTPINHLIKKTNPKLVKQPLTKVSKADVKQIKTQQLEATKKAMQSDSKSGKLIKVVAIAGVVGITGFGIYKFIQFKKQNNGHISTSK